MFTFWKKEANPRKTAVLGEQKMPLITVSITLSLELLDQVERNIKGKTRTAKLRKCVEKGYEMLQLRKEVKK